MGWEEGYYATIQCWVHHFSLYSNIILVCVLNWCASDIESVIACIPVWQRKGISHQCFHIHCKFMLPIIWLVLNERLRQLLHISIKKHTFIFSYVRTVFLFHITYIDILNAIYRYIERYISIYIERYTPIYVERYIPIYIERYTYIERYISIYRYIERYTSIFPIIVAIPRFACL